MKKQQTQKHLAAKVPEELIKSLDRAAKMGGRTRSSELRMRLEHSLRQMQVMTPMAP